MKRYLAEAKMGGRENITLLTREIAMNSRAWGWDILRKFRKVSLMEISADGEVRAVERARLEHDGRETMRQWLSRLAQHEAKSDRCDSDRLGKFQLRGILPESCLANAPISEHLCFGVWWFILAFRSV
jgi:hypothetical protein